MALNATVGDAAANSYVTRAQANTYFTDRLQDSDWSNDATGDSALVMATRRLEILTYLGEKADSAQALKWPRIDVFDENGDEYDSDAIPEPVRQATYELALRILKDNAASTDFMAETGLEGFDRAKVGPVEVEPRHSRSAASIPGYVLDLIRHTLAGSPMMATLKRQ